MSWCLIFVFLALLSASVSTATLTTVNITDGKHLKKYLCSSKNTIPANTHLVIYPDKIKLRNLNSVDCLVENTTDIYITAWQENSNDSSRIVTVSCANHGGGFSFFNVSNLTIRSVYFESCGTSTFPNAAIKYVNGGDHFFFYNPLVKATLFLNHCHNLTLYNVLGDSYSDFQGYQSSIIGVNLCGWSSVTAVVSDTDLPTNHLLTLLIYYIDTAIMPSSIECNLLVETNLLSGSKFVNVAQDLVGSPKLMPVRPIGDFSLFLAQQKFNVNADVTVLPMSPSDSQLDCIKSSSCNSRVVILFVNSVTDSRVMFQGYPYQFCTDVSSVPYPNYRSIQLDVFFYETPSFSGPAMFHSGMDSTLIISNTSFIGFDGGLGNNMPNGGDNILRILDFSRKLSHQVEIKNVAWCNNKVFLIPDWNPSKLSHLLHSQTIFQGTVVSFPMLHLKMSGLHVENNIYGSNDQLRQLSTDSLVQFMDTEVTISGTNYFGHNSDGSVIRVVSSNLTLTGDLTIKDGFTFQGGGIQLDTDSYLFLKEPLVAEFINNSAQHGSAIYAPVHIDASEFSTDKTASTIQILPNEFYSLDNLTDIDVTLHFVRSSLESSLYAPDFTFFGKQISPKFLFNADTWDSVNTQYAYTSLVDAIINASEVDKYTSLSNGVCFGIEGQDLDCSYSDDMYHGIVYVCEGFDGPTVSVYPGQSAISLICADNKEYQVSPNDVRIDKHHVTCETASYGLLNVSYSEDNVSLSFGVPNFKPYSQSYCLTYSNMALGRSVPFLNVTLLYPCPLGFDLAESGVCDPIDALKKKKYDANIEDLSFTSPPNSYTGYYSNHGKDILYINTNCPPNFCKNVTSTFSLNEFLFDFSCLHNRSGILCGQCANQSAVFGSDACFSDCSNLYLLTLPVYALAGLLLVVVFFVLRLTVASGTINGVIFYANILSLSMDVLSNQNSEFHLEPLQIIISLLNLNLGFPLCLYDGMTTAAKAFFQFVFPVYLWSIVLGLIVASRFSVRLSGIIAHSSIQVLSTLFYLSFSKLINTAMYVFSTSSISTITYTPSESYAFSDFTVWYYSGVHYGSSFHGFLLFLAAVFMLLFVLPYTVLLTFSYYFMQFKIVNKFRPFLDAYGGPFNDK